MTIPVKTEARRKLPASFQKTAILILILLSCFTPASTIAQTVTGAMGEIFSYRIIADKLSDPWEITVGPDDYLWVTEARGYRVSRINPVTKDKMTLLDLNNSKTFDRYQNNVQGGLMGLAIHPDLLNGKPYVYLAYVHQFEKSLTNDGGSFYRTKIVRYIYNVATTSLSNPLILCDTIPGSNDHNGGRLVIAPIGDVNYLFYSVGDMGEGQFNNGGRTNNAQRSDIYEGKILRFNLEPDGNSGTLDRWIPDNNPYNNLSGNGRQNAVWTIGHRNPQGLCTGIFSGQSRIYSVEHGPFSDDEINIIEAQRNYGHPLVIGMNDGNYNGLAAAATRNTTLPQPWQTSLPTITDENVNAQSIGTAFKAPMKTLYPSSNSFLNTILTAVKNNNTSTGFPNGNSMTWQSEATSSIDVYTKSAIPAWNNSLLITTLKGGKLIRLKLNAAGDAITGDTINYFASANRYRDIAFSNDGSTFYLSIDSNSVTSGPSATNPQIITSRGSIIEFTYVGECSGTGTYYYRDNDNDGFGNTAEYINACSPAAGYVNVKGDCNDNINTIYPGAPELCDGLDNDCDGFVDNNTTLKTFYRDADGDTYGSNTVTTSACAQPAGYVSRNGDCNDANPLIHPNAPETCNQVDDDCDGLVDEGLQQQTYYQDYDNDGWGNDLVTKQACMAPTGYVSRGGDCNDRNNKVYPGATEVSNQIDDNCDGVIDEGFRKQTYYQDYDKDGWGNNAITKQARTAPPGYVARGGDCNDRNKNIYPGAVEVINGLDDDCDGLIDEPSTGAGSSPLLVSNSTGGLLQSKQSVNEEDYRFEVLVSPNPTRQQFVVKLNSSDKETKVTIRVLDVTGRLIVTRSNI